MFNKLLWLVYKAFRMVYVSLWFYFVPFIVIIGSYLVPLFGENKVAMTQFQQHLFEMTSSFVNITTTAANATATHKI